MKRPSTFPIAPSSTGEDTSLLSKALGGLSGASSLKDEWVGHHLTSTSSPSIGRPAGARCPCSLGAGGAGVGALHRPHGACSCELAVRALGVARGRLGGGWGSTWALSCPLAWQQFHNAVQYVSTTTSTKSTGGACKAAVKAYDASLLPPTAMCEIVLNMRAPNSSWRTLLEL